MATLESLEKRIDGFDARFDKIESLVESLAISVKEGFDRVDERFEQMDRRFDIIENISIKGHERRIENLEDRVRVVETKTKIRKK